MINISLVDHLVFHIQTYDKQSILKNGFSWNLTEQNLDLISAGFLYLKVSNLYGWPCNRTAIMSIFFGKTILKIVGLVLDISGHRPKSSHNYNYMYLINKKPSNLKR